MSKYDVVRGDYDNNLRETYDADEVRIESGCLVLYRDHEVIAAFVSWRCVFNQAA